MSESFVVVKNLTKQFPKSEHPALDDLSLSLPKGKIIALAGPDGAGKTTLIRLIAGLLLPTKGTITVGGFDTITNAESIHRIIGYMPQKFGLYEDLTVMENLVLYADLKGVFGEKRKEVFERLLSFTGLSPFTDRLARALSGGMKQKLGLACSLLSQPSLLLLDEPSVGVDPISRRELWKMTMDLVHDNVTVLWSTAYLDEAEKCDYAVLLNEGKILFDGKPHELAERMNGFVYEILGSDIDRRKLLEKVLSQPNVVDGLVQGNHLRVVVRDKNLPIINPKETNVNEKIKIKPIPPCFEDAFIYLLDKEPMVKSELAEMTPKLEVENEIMIVADHLTKQFGDFVAADNISFKVKTGEVFGLLGPNGAGKSTTFKMMCGLLTPTSGSTTVNGSNPREASGAARAQIGYMAQKFSLYGGLSVYQNLKFFSGIYNLSGDEQKKTIDEMVEIFALEPYLNTSTDELPLGFKQRVALSCAVMHHPKILFLDEPTSGVDPIVRREFWCHINGLVQKGITIMVTTHFMEEAEYCDRIALVFRGKVISMGTPDQLKHSVATKENPYPTLEQAFIEKIERYEDENG